MRPLHPIDFIFLSLEKRQQPMHVGGLFLFQIPENAPASFIQNLVADIRNSKSIPIPPFNNKLNGLFWDMCPTDYGYETVIVRHKRFIILTTMVIASIVLWAGAGTALGLYFKQRTNI